MLLPLSGGEDGAGLGELGANPHGCADPVAHVRVAAEEHRRGGADVALDGAVDGDEVGGPGDLLGTLGVRRGGGVADAGFGGAHDPGGAVDAEVDDAGFGAVGVEGGEDDGLLEVGVAVGAVGDVLGGALDAVGGGLGVFGDGDVGGGGEAEAVDGGPKVGGCHLGSLIRFHLALRSSAYATRVSSEAQHLSAKLFA